MLRSVCAIYINEVSSLLVFCLFHWTNVTLAHFSVYHLNPPNSNFNHSIFISSMHTKSLNFTFRSSSVASLTKISSTTKSCPLFIIGKQAIRNLGWHFKLQQTPELLTRVWKQQYKIFLTVSNLKYNSNCLVKFTVSQFSLLFTLNPQDLFIYLILPLLSFIYADLVHKDLGTFIILSRNLYIHIRFPSIL